MTRIFTLRTSSLHSRGLMGDLAKLQLTCESASWKYVNFYLAYHCCRVCVPCLKRFCLGWPAEKADRRDRRNPQAWECCCWLAKTPPSSGTQSQVLQCESYGLLSKPPTSASVFSTSSLVGIHPWVFFTQPSVAMSISLNFLALICLYSSSQGELEGNNFGLMNIKRC